MKRSPHRTAPLRVRSVARTLAFGMLVAGAPTLPGVLPAALAAGDESLGAALYESRPADSR